MHLLGSVCDGDAVLGRTVAPSRRDLLLALAVAMTGGAVRPAAARGRTGRGERVVVVGAGFAGLGAARELHRRGCEVVVLEARDRLGGRAWTSSSLGFPIDLGASWIEGVQGNPLTDLAREAGARTVATDDDSWAGFDADGRRLTDGELGEIESDLAWLVRQVERLAGTLDGEISIGAAVEKVVAEYSLTAFEKRALAWCLASLATDSGADLDEMALLGADDDDGFGGASVLLVEGFASLARHLARDLDVRLETPVRWIEARSDGVRVGTDGGVVSAQRVLVTVPLGILAADRIRFDPPLPAAKRHAFVRLRMGLLDKAVLVFPRVAWPDAQNLAYLSATPGEWPAFLDLARTLDRPVLVGFCAGRFARRMEERTDDQVAGEVLGILRRMVGAGLPDPVAFLRTRWAADPHALGSYSFVPVGATAALRDVLAEPVGHRVFFAGEATSSRYPATVHGAYLSGLREAARIVAAAG